MPLPLATLRQTAVFMGGSRPPDVGLGLLTRWCPASLIDAAIETCDTREQRVRVLSARSVVYCELARCLFTGEGYEQILDHLLSRDDDIAAWRTDHIPCGSSLCRARVKIGSRTMEAVFHRVAGPIAEPQSCPAAFWHQLRLEAFYGTTSRWPTPRRMMPRSSAPRAAAGRAAIRRCGLSRWWSAPRMPSWTR